MKRTLLSLMLVCFAFLGIARAQTTVEIGDGNATSNTNPIGTYYNYSISEQLYTADEIGMAGTITSVSFYYLGLAEKEFPINVYMKQVDELDLSSGGISLEDAETVFSGTLAVTTTEGWVTINLDTPFAYDASSSLLIGIIKDYLYYFSGQSWQGTATTATMACYTQSDSAGPYTTSTVPSSAQANRPNIQMVINPSSGPTCDRPDTMEATDVTAHSANLSWSGGSGTYNVEYKKTADSDWTALLTHTTSTSYTLTDLDMITSYLARVQSVCAEANSGWKAVSFTTMEECPDGMVCIGEGTATNTYLPSYNFYNYSLTEQIYTAEEIGQAAAILSVDIFSVGTVTRTLEFYMVNTEKETFTDGNDWITATENDLVFNGSVTWAANSWNTIEFDPPFIYDGNSNVALIVRDMTGSYTSPGNNFYVFDAPQQAIRIYRDGGAYDFAAPGEGTVMDVKNRVRFAMGEPPTCFKPTGLTAEVQGAHGAVLNWNSDAPAWQILLNNDIIDVTTKPYTLTGLDAETDYTVGVRGNCGDDDFSDWAYVSFTTDVACPKPTNLSATPYLNSADISWVGYSDGYEMEYALTPTGNKSDELAYSFEGDFEGWTTIDADGDGFNWELGSVLMAGYIIPSHDGEDCVTSQSYDGDGQVPLTPDNYLVSPQIILGGSLTFWACAQDASYAAEHFGVAVSVTGNTSPRDFTTIEEWDMTAKRVKAPLANKVLRQYLSKNGNRANREGTWYQYTVDLSDYQGRAGYVAIRHFDCSDMFYLDVDDITIVEGVLGDIEWIPVGTVTSPYTLTGLESGTSYMVRVRANCGEDGVSDWVTIGFATHGACEMPISLAANDITSNSATLNWTGYQESFNVKYRSLAKIEEVVSSENFDEGLADWTTIDADADGYTWVTSMSPGAYHNSGVDLTGNGHNDSEHFVLSGSYSNSASTALTPDNYLVSPLIDLGGGMEFWACAQDASYPYEHFGVAVSTAGNTAASDFTTIAEWTIENGNTWTKYVVDLSNYSGQGYVAIRHFDCTDMFILNVDDIAFGTFVPASEWVTVEGVTAPYKLTGLNPGTTYEWQIQGVNANCDELEWTAIQSFTTLAGFTQTIELVSGTNYIASSVDITLADLEDALAATWTTGHNITIKSQNKNVVYRAGRWVGQLNESNFDVASMYVILIDYATEITLEGTPIDPAEHPITVPAGGTVYIGFPLTTSMTPADAFAGFAANGDVVKSQNQNSTFRGGRWVGQLSTLEPGKGYKYISNATSERTLVFPAE